VRPEFSLAEHLEREVDRRDAVPARIWLAKRVQQRARAESYATLVEEKPRDGGAEFSLYSFSLEWLAHWLLGFGGDAEAVAPAKLRELVRRTAADVARRHGAQRS
jgi:predicted DNA-binding transcriptional regulator YafY